MIKHDQRKPDDPESYDTDVDSDDSFFVDIHRSYPYGDMYHLIVNGMNTHYDWSQGGALPGAKEKGINLQFNPKWVTPSTLTVDHGWRLEGKIPWADMKLDEPKPGESLRMNFMRNWHTIRSGNALRFPMLEWNFRMIALEEQK